ncbi:DUF1799 domain-containing protein [Methylococcus mesophilus]|uniref:DUF1799 domain-containing protein n=1 Tax=Methylococcus mesophilus TaxID=2993564 RepID=UPI00224B5C61|nr:DUF1799 domain-containing protein [Methylococcus mesophilus]UZR27481.1 DUF1799 domain-containing protein [Methylococcus mesophilus]
MTQAQEEAAPADTDFYVMEDNWDTVMAFLACRTRWQREFPPLGGPAIWLGLNYSDVEVVIRNLGHEGEAARQIFAGIQVMEAAALAVFHPPAVVSTAGEQADE